MGSSGHTILSQFCEVFYYVALSYEKFCEPVTGLRLCLCEELGDALDNTRRASPGFLPLTIDTQENTRSTAMTGEQKTEFSSTAVANCMQVRRFERICRLYDKNEQATLRR